MLGLLTACGDDSDSQTGDNPGMAKRMCQDFVEDRLRAPGTADFSGITETQIVATGTSTYTVTGHVDAQNGFGAQIRTGYVCQVRDAGDQWTLLDLQTS